MKRALATAAILACSAVAASADDLIVTLSTDEVRITSNFSGTGVTVFGAAELANLAADTPLELVIVLRGPAESVTVRRKDHVLGLWINRAEAVLSDMPAYYAVHATAPLNEIASPVSLTALGLGLGAVAADAGPSQREFASAMVRLLEEEGVYYELPDSIDWLDGRLFRTTFELPADVPVGAYSVEVLAFSHGLLLASAQQPLEIIKTGSEQFIYEASHSQPWLYAIAIVIIAATAGWLGGVLFRRD